MSINLSIDKEAKQEAERLVMMVMNCRIPSQGSKPPQGVGRYLAREIAKKIVEEKNYEQRFKEKVITYLSLKQWS